MSFGGQSWPINPVDFNAGQVSTGRNPLCLGAIFDLSLGANSNEADSSQPTWVVGDTFLVRNPLRLYLLSFISYPSSLYRKTCTRCFVPIQLLLALLSCLLRLVGQVQQHPGLPRAPLLPEARPQALLPLGILVCVPFFPVDQSFSYSSPPPRCKCCYFNHIPFIPATFNGHYCYHVMSINGAGLCFYSTPNLMMSLYSCTYHDELRVWIIYFNRTMHHFSELYIIVGFRGPLMQNSSTKNIVHLSLALYRSPGKFTQIFPEQTDSIQSTSLLTVVRL